MARSTSNDNGRALEYALTQALASRYPQAIIDSDTQTDQLRDRDKFLALSNNDQRYFRKNSDYFANYILASRIGSNNVVIGLSRLKDGSGTEGDVTDIRLYLADREHYNISLKHNHKAVKHQRPGALIGQLGIADAQIAYAYKQSIVQISKRFYERVLPCETTFNAAKLRDAAIITDLYRDICQNTISYINRYSAQAPTFFNFLVGRFNFDKVVIRKNLIELMTFSDIPSPTTMTAKLHQDSYIILTFDNGFIFNMRLHTASSRFEHEKALSLKFDTQLISDSVETISYSVD